MYRIHGLAGVSLECKSHEAEAARALGPCLGIGGFDQVDALDRPAVLEHCLDVLCRAKRGRMRARVQPDSIGFTEVQRHGIPLVRYLASGTQHHFILIIE